MPLRVRAHRWLLAIPCGIFMLGIAASASADTAVTSHQRSPNEWSELAVDDLHFIRAMLRENHPGPVDRSNPAFREWFERGFGEALELARKAHSYAGYYFAIQKYVTGFQDGHLGAGSDRFSDQDKLKRQWPGFIVALDRDRFRVSESILPNLPAGAELEDCDGRRAAALADEILRPYFGLWSLRGSRFQSAPFLLVDEGNPFVARPRECRFRVGRQSRTLRLNWQPIANAELAPKVKAAQQRIESQTGIRPFGKNGWWITLASFESNGDAQSGPLLKTIRTLEDNPTRFRDADVIVFDVRGNNGGNSAYGGRIASAIWGDQFAESVPYATAVDWRVSQANLTQIADQNLPSIEKAFGKDDPTTRAYAEFAQQMEAALKRGDIFYHQAFDPPVPGGRPLKIRPKIFLLTDGWCHSACLDFADLVLAAPGAIQVGRETSADTIYIDNAAARLPSGEGFVGWSMKVYRGRPRGQNQSYLPKYEWTGSMADTAGLEKWIAGLAQ